MLKLRSLEIRDFGPFKDKQTLHFPDQDGVTIVYGRNMRGKTMLLNAIRYAFYEKVIYRGSTEVSLHRIGNWEKALEGHFGFGVTLKFDYQDSTYELIRDCKPRDGVDKPNSDEDYFQETILRRDGTVLGPDASRDELSRIMPEKVSRFFLFDGELLQQYEQLLMDESDMGPKIKDAIERILGVPILTNARADLTELNKKAQKEESRAAKTDERTKAIGEFLEATVEKRNLHEEEVQRLNGVLESRRDDKANLEGFISRNQRVRVLIEEADSHREGVGSLEGRIEQQLEKVREIMGSAWLGMLSRKIRAIQEEYEERLEKIKEIDARRAVFEETKRLLSSGIDSGTCPICNTDLSADSSSHLKSELSKLNANDAPEHGADDLDEVLGLLGVLREHEAEDRSELLVEILQGIDEMYVDRVSKLDRIKEISEDIDRHDPSEVMAMVSKYEKSIEDISIIEDGIKQEGIAVNKEEDNIRKLEQKLDRIEGSGFERERRKREISHQLLNLFEEGVGLYRERLRHKVQNDATEIFLSLTHEPDYSSLRINDNYGLAILHKDGEEIPVRSAGAEHIVALSLIAALQRNSPLRGPIVMDSPLIRLDDDHKDNVIRNLPNMADQVALLVFRSELSPQDAREKLLGNLKAEYSLLRHSARHTTIEIMED